MEGPWISYISLSRLDEESAATQIQALTLCFSCETLTFVDNLGLSTEQCENVLAIITAIKQHVDGHINESVECYNFRKWVQQCGKTFDDYLVALCELIKTCNFCSPACTVNINMMQTSIGHIDHIKRWLQQVSVATETFYAQQTSIQDRQVSVVTSIGYNKMQHIYTANIDTRQISIGRNKTQSIYSTNIHTRQTSIGHNKYSVSAASFATNNCLSHIPPVDVCGVYMLSLAVTDTMHHKNVSFTTNMVHGIGTTANID